MKALYVWWRRFSQWHVGLSSPGSIVNVWFAHSLWPKHIATIEYKKEGKEPISETKESSPWTEKVIETQYSELGWIYRLLVSELLCLRFDIFQGKGWGRWVRSQRLGWDCLPCERKLKNKNRHKVLDLCLGLWGSSGLRKAKGNRHSHGTRNWAKVPLVLWPNLQNLQYLHKQAPRSLW